MKGILTFLAGILSVIAVGVLLIAYGLLNPRLVAGESALVSRPMYAGDRVTFEPNDPFDTTTQGYRARPVSYPVNSIAAMNGVRGVPAVETYQAPRNGATASRSVQYVDRPARVARSSGRDWVKTAMVIGGSTAAGAGIGAIFGGKKGALIGAALGGGASTIYEVRK